MDSEKPPSVKVTTIKPSYSVRKYGEHPGMEPEFMINVMKRIDAISDEIKPSHRPSEARMIHIKSEE